MSVIRPGYWDPWDLGDDLYAWWNSDDHGSSLMTDAGGGLIQSFKDRKHRIDLTASGSARPTWRATGFNSSKPALVFDGVANGLRGTDVSKLPMGNIPCEIWQSLEFTGPYGTATIRFPFAVGGSGAGANKMLSRYQMTTGPQFTINNGSVSSVPTLTTLPKIYGMAFAGTTMQYRYDGKAGLFIPEIADKATGGGTERVAIGTNVNNTPGNFWIGPIRQTLITKILSASNRLRMEGWLAWDGGIQSVLP